MKVTECFYEIQGRRLSQGEMTLGRTKRLIGLTTELAGVDMSKIKDAKSAITWLIENDLIDRALDIILVGEKEGIVWDDLTNSQLEVIVSDFLAFNSGWIKRLSASLKNMLNVSIPTIKKKNSGKS